MLLFLGKFTTNIIPYVMKYSSPKILCFVYTIFSIHYALDSAQYLVKVAIQFSRPSIQLRSHVRRKVEDEVENRGELASERL